MEEAHLCRRGEERQVEIGEEGKYGRRLSGDGKSQLYPFLTLINRFLLATKRLYMSVVCPSVGWSVGYAFAFRPTSSDLCRVVGLVDNKAQQPNDASMSILSTFSTCST